MSFEPCPSCSRHVATIDRACPFCGARTIVAPRSISYAARLTRAAVFAGAAACAGTAAKPPPPPPPVEYPFALPATPAEGRASVSGVVRENGHRRSVRVVLRSEDGLEHDTISNEKGEYQFLDLEPGLYEIVPAPDYQNPRPQDGPVIQQPIRVPLAANANERHDLFVMSPLPNEPDTGPCCKPYGAPPARRRIV